MYTCPAHIHHIILTLNLIIFHFANPLSEELHFVQCSSLSGSGTTTSSSGGTGGGSKGYTQAWLRGEGPMAHVHEGIRLQDKSGWVAIGETLNEDVSRRSKVESSHCTQYSAQIYQVQVRRVDNEAATQWTTNIGEGGGGKFSVGYSVIEVSCCLGS